MAGLLEKGPATRKRENGQNRLGKCIGLYLSAENHPAWKLPHERLISFEHNAYNCQMLDGRLFVLFFAAATLLAVTPVPESSTSLRGLSPEASEKACYRLRRNQRVASGVGMIGLGAFVAFGEK